MQDFLNGFYVQRRHNLAAPVRFSAKLASFEHFYTFLFSCVQFAFLAYDQKLRTVSNPPQNEKETLNGMQPRGIYQ